MRMGRYSNRARNSRMLTVMTTPEFESLLSTHARYAVPLTTPRASMNPLYEFGGGYPDPVSFPYERMIEATAKMMPGGDALENPRRRRAAGLAVRPEGNDSPAAVVPLRRRHESVHVARGHVLPQGQPRAARAAADRRLSRQARRHAARTGRGARGHRRRDQPARGRLLPVDQATARDGQGTPRGARGRRAHPVHARSGLLRQRRRRGLHSPGLQ